MRDDRIALSQVGFFLFTSTRLGGFDAQGPCRRGRDCRFNVPDVLPGRDERQAGSPVDSVRTEDPEKGRPGTLCLYMRLCRRGIYLVLRHVSTASCEFTDRIQTQSPVHLVNENLDRLCRRRPQL